MKNKLQRKDGGKRTNKLRTKRAKPIQHTTNEGDEYRITSKAQKLIATCLVLVLCTSMAVGCKAQSKPIIEKKQYYTTSPAIR